MESEERLRRLRILQFALTHQADEARELEAPEDFTAKIGKLSDEAGELVRAAESRARREEEVTRDLTVPLAAIRKAGDTER